MSQLGRYLGRTGQRFLEIAFRLLRTVAPSRERVVLGECNDRVEREHVARYRFAKQYCSGKTVADIACGSGYGCEILREVAASVEGYDKEPLCGNVIIDLEKESWHKTYDVIVSFETIEHLARPDFFLENACKTCRLLIVSTPIGEFKGYNTHHKQTWELPEFKAKVEKWFDCVYYYQQGEEITNDPAGSRVLFVIAVGSPRK